MAFFVVGLPGLAVALLALLIPEPRRGATEEVDEEHRRREAPPVSLGAYAALARNRSYVYNTLGIALFTFALGGLQWWAPKYLSTGEGAPSLADATFGLGVAVVIGGLVGTALGPWLGDYFDRRGVRGAYFLVSGLPMLASAPLTLLAITGALFGWNLYVVLAFILIVLVLTSLSYGPSYAILTNVTAPNMRAAAFAVNTFLIHFLGDIPSPYIMGAVSDLTRHFGWVPDLKTSLFWGLAVTLPAMVASGVFFCLGVPHLEKDQEAVLRELRAAPPPADKADTSLKR
jgi:MFS family permease